MKKTTPTMKAIGVLGGMSWESTARYYHGLNAGVRARLGGLHSARILMSSVDFASIVAWQEAGKWTQAADYLATQARTLERAGADCILLATNTMHKVADAIEDAIQIPFIHLADATALAVRADGIDTVGLLATRYTMEEEFYISRLERHGLTVLTPDPEQYTEINRIIFEELCRGIVREASRVTITTAAEQMLARGAKGLIFGCTEIGLLTKARDFTAPVFDTTFIHIDAALDFALGGVRAARDEPEMRFGTLAS